jgi:hypothetical protein
VGTERVSGCIYGGNRESEWVYVWREQRVSGGVYGGNRESDWVYIWWEHRE